jgi:hypothetical protein
MMSPDETGERARSARRGKGELPQARQMSEDTTKMLCLVQKWTFGQMDMSGNGLWVTGYGVITVSLGH